MWAGNAPGSGGAFLDVDTHGCVSLLVLVQEMPPHIDLVACVLDAAALLGGDGALSTMRLTSNLHGDVAQGRLVTQSVLLSTTRLRASSRRGWRDRRTDELGMDMGVKGSACLGGAAFRGEE